MYDRVVERLAATGQTPRGASMLASDGRRPDLIRDMERKGHVPKADALERLAEVLETTVGYLRTGRRDTTLLADRRTGFDAGPTTAALDLPRSLPVHGTALAADLTFGDDGSVVVEAHELVNETVDYLRRPPMLADRKDVYAIYVYGTSMEPKFESGEALIVDSARPPRIGDYVVVQLAHPDGEQDMRRMALIKRLVKKTRDHIELEQFNPALTFHVETWRVEAVHRVMSLADLLG